MKSLLWLAVVIFGLLGAAFGATFLLDPHSQSQIQTLILGIGGNLWTFARPLLQLVVILLIVEYFAAKAGWRLTLRNHGFKWDLKAIIAIVVVATYCIAALSGVEDRYGIKDIVEIVIGFYFGATHKAATEGKDGADSGPPEVVATQ